MIKRAKHTKKSQGHRIEDIQQAVSVITKRGSQATTIAIAREIKMQPNGRFYDLCRLAWIEMYINAKSDVRGESNVTVYIPKNEKNEITPLGEIKGKTSQELMFS